jgi:pimeloyl-ACP methyl ester carboxylesterase
MAQPASPDILFLHGGPGLSCALERRLLPTSLPILFWDQPHVRADEEQPFTALIEATEEQVRCSAEACGGPVSLVASSFGARLALELLQRRPELIRAVTVSGGVLDAREAFIRLGRRLLSRYPALAEPLEGAGTGEGPQRLWPLIGAISVLPNLTDEYFTSQAVREREAARELAASGELVDGETFQAVLSEALTRPPQPLRGSSAIRVHVLIGRADPYALPDDREYWLRFLPQAHVSIVDTGHFPHLELPPIRWLPQLKGPLR